MNRAAILLFLMAWFAGCSSPPGSEEGADELANLADRTVCAFQYPDGRPVPCTDGTQTLEWQATPPFGWVCQSSLASGPGGDYSLYRHPDGRQALAYGWAEREPPYDGLVYAQEGAPLYRWESPAADGFVVLPAEVVASPGGFVIYLSQVRLETATEELVGHHARSLFTRFDGGVLGDLWHLYELAGPGPSYYASGTFRVVNGDHVSHGVANVHLLGSDHEALLTYGSNGGLAIGSVPMNACLA